jgi:hypothetical protein
VVAIWAAALFLMAAIWIWPTVNGIAWREQFPMGIFVGYVIFTRTSRRPR